MPIPELLKLNPSATICRRMVGRDAHRVVIVDDFYLHPERVRELANQAAYSRDPRLVLDYPGERALIPGETRHLVGAVCEYYGKKDKPSRERIPIAFSAPSDRIALSSAQRQPHTDEAITALVYLNRPQECAGGTGLYRHRPTAMELIPHRVDPTMIKLARDLNYDIAILKEDGGYEAFTQRVFFNPDFASLGNEPINDGNDYWELMELIEMRFNRLVIFDGQIPHSIYAKAGDFTNARRLCQLLSVSLDGV